MTNLYVGEPAIRKPGKLANITNWLLENLGVCMTSKSVKEGRRISGNPIRCLKYVKYAL